MRCYAGEPAITCVSSVVQIELDTHGVNKRDAGPHHDKIPSNPGLTFFRFMTVWSGFVYISANSPELQQPPVPGIGFRAPYRHQTLRLLMSFI
jgi:hypothetical protein